MFLPVGIVDALADLFGCVTHLLLSVVGAILQNMGPSSIHFLHFASQVNGSTGCSRWLPLVHGQLEHGELTNILRQVVVRSIGLHKVAESLNESVSCGHCEVEL